MGERSVRSILIRPFTGFPQLQGFPFPLRKEIRRKAVHAVAKTRRFWIAMALSALAGLAIPASPFLAMYQFDSSRSGEFMIYLPILAGLFVFLICTFAWDLIYRPAVENDLARRKDEMCLGCGYDIRGSPGRCPECGRERTLGRDD